MATLFMEATAPRTKIYPRHVNGRFHKLRNVVSVILQALLFVVPWIQWGGQQAVLFDVPGRKLYLFNLVLQPQETYFLLFLSIIGALVLFASTAVAGRVWCGYACPQTLFTQSFISVERFFEGDRAQRMRLDKRPWDAEKFRIKLCKLAVWTIMGVWLGITFAGYYVPIRGLVADMATGHPGQSTVLIIALFTAFSLFDYGYFREQFCTYICPYARFQGSMFDQNSYIIGYDTKRGEPRGKAKDDKSGSCVDCTMCVQACPMGIDIRKGLQLECIACAACIDACDDVMEKLDRPTGLIRYTSLLEMQGEKTQLVRPRLVIYTIILTALIGGFLWQMTHRQPLSIDLVRQAPGGGQNFLVNADGRISNPYRVHLVNRRREPQDVVLSVKDFPGAELVTPTNPYHLEAGEVATLTVLILHPREGLKAVQKFEMEAQSGDLKVSHEARFLAPTGQ